MKVMKRLNEKDIIKIFQSKKFTPEDVEIFRIGSQMCASNIDTLVESTDIPPRSNFMDIARKSVVSSVSDFAAKGILPKFCMISVTIPKKISKKHIIELSTGFKKACKNFH